MSLVSVIIAAHNGEAYLGEAIESVLRQTYPDVELWVIDNGSTDQTPQIARSFPQVHYRSSSIANVALARNQGALASQGEYIAFLDQDDTWAPQKLEQQVAFLTANPSYGAVIGLQHIYLEPGCSKPHWLKQEFLEQPQHGYLPSALMLRRAAFFDLFDPTLTLTSDADWFFKAYDAGIEVGELPEVLLHRRIHEENNSSKCEALQKELLLILKRSMARKRGELCAAK